jgi:hypothetical protein
MVKMAMVFRVHFAHADLARGFLRKAIALALDKKLIDSSLFVLIRVNSWLQFLNS